MLAALLCNLPVKQDQPAISGGLLPWMVRRPRSEDELQALVERIEESPLKVLSAELENVLSRYRGPNALEPLSRPAIVGIPGDEMAAMGDTSPEMEPIVPVVDWNALLMDLDRVDRLMRLHRLVIDDEAVVLLL